MSWQLIYYNTPRLYDGRRDFRQKSYEYNNIILCSITWGQAM